MSDRVHALGKFNGMPMVIATLRKTCWCVECKVDLAKKTRVYRPLLDGSVGGLNRGDRICVLCMNAHGVVVADS